MVRAMCGVVLNDRRAKNLMLRSDLNETIGQEAIASNVRWHNQTLMREDGHWTLRSKFKRRKVCQRGH